MSDVPLYLGRWAVSCERGTPVPSEVPLFVMSEVPLYLLREANGLVLVQLFLRLLARKNPPPPRTLPHTYT